MLEEAFIPTGTNGAKENICLQYRTENGFGGMDRKVALFAKGLTRPSVIPELPPVIEDDSYLPLISEDACEGIGTLRDLTKGTLAILAKEESQTNKK
jgi:arginine/ornithine N-succinyltransferase beta subunit